MSDVLNLSSFGWAPGGYIITCHACRAPWKTGAKGSFRCHGCALAAMRAHVPEPAHEVPGAILARSTAHAKLAELFPGWALFAPYRGKVGLRFKRVLVILVPCPLSEAVREAEIQWVNEWRNALPRGGEVEWINL